MPALLPIWRIARWPLVAAATLGVRALVIGFVGDHAVIEIRIRSYSDAGCRASFTRNHGMMTNSTKADTPCNSDREFDDHFRVRCSCPNSP